MPRLRRWAAQAAIGKDLKAAQAAAYAAMGKIHFDSAHFHRDIAVKAF
jgi:phosphoribosylamine-glycine ligase